MKSRRLTQLEIWNIILCKIYFIPVNQPKIHNIVGTNISSIKLVQTFPIIGTNTGGIIGFLQAIFGSAKE